MEHTPIQIRCKGIILHENKVLVVRHTEASTYFAFPGGHLEWGETPVECVKREIMEELGVEPVIGSLLYVNTFIQTDGTHNIEFFFEIKNAFDYLDTSGNDRSHAHEIHEILWLDKNHDFRLLPVAIDEEFKKGEIVSEITKQIKSK